MCLKTHQAATSSGEYDWPISKLLILITDCSSGLRLLVDTGTKVSVVPLTSTEHKHQQDGFTLQAVNHTPIKISSPNLLLISDISSCNNSVADALSRLEIRAIHQRPLMIDFAAMAFSEQSDQELQVIQSLSSSSLKFTDIPIADTETTLVCNTSTGVFQPYVPKGLGYQAFEYYIHFLI